MGRRNDAVVVFFDHGHGAGDQVPQVVGQVGIEALHKALYIKAAVVTEGEFPQEEVFQRVHAVKVDNGLGIDDIALGLAHFVVVKEDPAVTEDLFRQGQIQCHKHGGPNNGVETHDFLAYQVHIRRPEIIKFFFVGAQAATR